MNKRVGIRFIELHRAGWSLALVSLLLLLPSLSRAESAQGLSKAHAKIADAEYNLGHFEKAAAEYEEAYRYVQNSVFLFQAGQGWRMAGNFERAVIAYRAYLRNAPHKEVKRLVAEKHLKESEARLQERRGGPGAFAPRPAAPVGYAAPRAAAPPPVAYRMPAPAATAAPIAARPAAPATVRAPAPTPAPAPAPARTPAQAVAKAPVAAPAAAPAKTAAPAPAKAPAPASGGAKAPATATAKTTAPATAKAAAVTPQTAKTPAPAADKAPTPKRSERLAEAAPPEKSDKPQSPGLDLELTQEAPDKESSPSPVYKRWWFWTGLVAVAAAGAGAGFMYWRSTKSGTTIPGTTLGAQGAFQ
jgi:hypothetical protein